MRLHGDELSSVPGGRDQELVGRARRHGGQLPGREARRRQLGDPQRAAQAAHADRVGAAERAGEQFLRRGVVEGGGAQGHTQQDGSGRTPGSWTSGTSSPATATGTPAVSRARRSIGTWRPAERTSTAIGTTAPRRARCALRRVSATTRGLLGLAVGEQDADLAGVGARQPGAGRGGRRRARGHRSAARAAGTRAGGTRSAGRTRCAGRPAARRPAPHGRRACGTCRGS